MTHDADRARLAYEDASVADAGILATTDLRIPDALWEVRAAVNRWASTTAAEDVEVDEIRTAGATAMLEIVRAARTIVALCTAEAVRRHRGGGQAHGGDA